MDEQLQQLIEEVCGYEEGTPQRQKALNNLLIVVQKLPGIKKDGHQDYLEALNKTWEWFCRSIDKFDRLKVNSGESLTVSLVRWINGYLKWRIKDLYASDSNYTISLDQARSNDEGSKVTKLDILPDPKFENITLDLLDLKIAEIQQCDRQTWGERIIQFIEQDEKRLLRRSCTRNNTECNCQFLAKRLLLTKPSHKIADIARELNVSNQTIYSHWKKKCLPLLKEIGMKTKD
ncbi:MAG: hypothetical protein WBA07_04530 [Rivularia sp. (in: cyanobacteria)]